MELNDTARAQLNSFGVTPTEWAQRNFGTDEWHGDACGCPDDRCIGYHHDNADDCSCLTVLLTSRHDQQLGTGEQAGLAVAHQADTHRPRPFVASFQGWTPDPDDLEQWPNSVRVEVVEGYDTTVTGEVTDDDLKYADLGEVRYLVEVDTNYKPSRDGNPVRLTRTDAAHLAAAVLEAVSDTFASRDLGFLRRDEALDLMFALEPVATALQRLRFAALADLSEELDDGNDQPASVEAAHDATASGTPVSKPIPALARPTEETPEAAAAREPLAEDAGEVSFTLEQQFGDALGAVFGNNLHEIASSDAYGALKYKVLHRCQRTGESPRQVLDTISASDRAFAGRANDPAAFLASRIGDER